MKHNLLSEFLPLIMQLHDDWRRRRPDFAEDATTQVDPERVRAVIDELFLRLDDNYPFFHPSYAGQMLKPPHPAAILGYFAAQLINPNNHALDGGPATGNMEKEITAELAALFGYGDHLGHLTGGGTIANLEALWVARKLNPDAAVAFSENAHYTHSRMCEVLGMRGITVPADARGKMDVDALRALALSEHIGAVVTTIGSTGLGALDPLPEILDIARSFDLRVHADAAYGGFFRLIAGDGGDAADARVFNALGQCDSIVVDPHKHGLQPYGCGCVIFRDPSVGRFYKHDSPYTYFTSDELHLGEISLECSRAGASAAALWTTMRLLPFVSDTGLGAMLRRCRTAALRFADFIRTSEHLYLILEPDLDIVAFFPMAGDWSSTAISELSARVFKTAMNDERAPVYLSLLRVKTSLLQARYPKITADGESTTVLRSVLMKPEHASYVDVLFRRIETFARIAISSNWKES